MNIGKAFNYPFKDPKWTTKMAWFALFSLLSMMIIGIPFVMGYMVLATKNACEGKEELPEWAGNWEKIFMEGLKYFVVTMVVSLVASLASSVSFGILGIAVMAFMPAITIRYATTLDIGATMDYKWIWEFTKNNISNVLIFMVMSAVFGMIASLGTIACFVGVFFTAYYAAMGVAYLTGELYRASGETSGSEKMTAPTMAAAPATPVEA